MGEKFHISNLSKAPIKYLDVYNKYLTILFEHNYALTTKDFDKAFSKEEQSLIDELINKYG